MKRTVMLDSYDPAKGYGKECYRLDYEGFGIWLFQNRSRVGSFSVQYGKQLDTGLSYAEACTELGAAIMHALACNGRLDNERN